MRVSPGSKLGPYEILAPVGRGGMGEVYRARDTSLGRDVAIKMLPADRLADETRRRRFVQEARAASALNHPNIVTIYQIESADGIDFIVMEYVAGKALDALIRPGMRLQEALKIAIPIADALARAHAAGIVHRDLKPSNVMVGSGDVIKVLDFGLAKLLAPEEPSPATDTLTAEAPGISLSRAGTIVGTPGYISPEQATGGKVDSRSDVFAFGALLYEMVTGRRAFAGNSAAEALAKVVSEEPATPSQLARRVPKDLEKLIQRCLRKEPERRFQHMLDVKIELQEIKEEHDSGLTAAPVHIERPRPWWQVAILLALALATALVMVWPTRAPVSPALMRFNFSAPDKGVLEPGAAVPSPDGRRIAFVARSASSERALWIRPLDSPTPRRIAGSEGASGPFWSPDGRFVGFFADGKLKKMDPSGGPAQNICPVGTVTGATWSRDGVIVFAPANRVPLHRVAAAGGTPEPITSLDSRRRENSHRWPHFLPDGRHFLFTARSDVGENTGIYVGSLGSKEKRWLLAAQSNAVYAPPGYLLFARERTLMARRFDANRLQLSGEAFAVAPDVGHFTESASALFSVSADGAVLTYQTPVTRMSRLTWFDRAGMNLGSVGPEGDFTQPRLAPNGNRWLS